MAEKTLEEKYEELLALAIGLTFLSKNFDINGKRFCNGCLQDAGTPHMDWCDVGKVLVIAGRGNIV